MDTLQSLNKPDSISIYASYIAPTSPTNPNRIQLKNLLKETRQLLTTRGLRSSEIASMLLPVDKLLDSEEFRANHNYSLALFINREFFVYYHLPPDEFDSFVDIGKGFYLEPIIKLVHDNPQYYVLNLSHNNVYILKGDRYSIEPLKLQGFPANMDEVLRIDEQPKDLQGHSVIPAAAGKGSKVFHGQYNAAQVDKELLVQFFRQVDQKIHRALLGATVPLILAGVDYLLPLYRQVSTYPHLLQKEIRGSLEHISLDSIRDNAYRLLASSVPA
jgi:hypothetical protein